MEKHTFPFTFTKYLSGEDVINWAWISEHTTDAYIDEDDEGNDILVVFGRLTHRDCEMISAGLESMVDT